MPASVITVTINSKTCLYLNGIYYIQNTLHVDSGL